MSVVRVYKKRGTAHNWTIELRDERGVPRRFTAGADKDAANRLAAKFQRLFELAAIRSDPDPDLLLWIDSLKAADVERLVRWRILSQRVIARGTPAQDMLAEWKLHRINHGVSEKEAEQARARVSRLLSACAIEYLHAATPEAITTTLGEWRRRPTNPVSIGTSNHYIVAVKGFARWARTTGRIATDPLAGLRKARANATTAIVRRYALTDEEQAKLIRATEAATVALANKNGQPGITGKDRALIYRVALRTGLRLMEMVRLRRADYDGRSLRVMGKNGDCDSQPVPADLAPHLDQRAARLLPHMPLLPCPYHANMSRMLRADCKRAGIAPAPGTKIDIHALRHSFITSLAIAGVHIRVAQRLARHKSIAMTQLVYTHLNLTDDLSGLGKLPSLDAAPAKAKKA